MSYARRRSIVPTVILAGVMALSAVPARGEQAMVKPPDSAMEEMKAPASGRPALSQGERLHARPRAAGPDALLRSPAVELELHLLRDLPQSGVLVG
jgi:hypothetical protein